MKLIESLVGVVNDALYGYILIILLVLAGLYFTVRTRFGQFRLFGEQIRAVKEKPNKEGAVSSFQALMVSTASRVGTGNIIGVSSAICLGGFGAIFWMWVIALLGCATAFIESTLAQIYKRKGKDGFCGGPAYYIETGLKNKPLALIFGVCLILTYGIGFNMLCSYNLQSTFSAYGFYNANTTPWIIGLVIAVLVGYCLFGGGKRILKTTGILVPVMGVAYVIVAIIVVLMNITAIPAVFAEIFRSAFDFSAIFGGFTGSCVMYGIKRGLYSNEAGVGSAPNAAASADVDHPVTQGLVQSLSVFIDTIIICSATALMCTTSGVEATAAIEGAPYVQAALSVSLGNFGPIFITIVMVLFAFTTLIGNLYYVDQCWLYMLGKEPGKAFRTVSYIVAALFIFVGAGLSAGLLWGIADVTMGLMAVINIPTIFILGKYAIRAMDDYEAKRKAGLPLTFKASDIDLPHKVEHWQ